MKLLIIEDDKKIAGLLKKSFETELFSVDAALDGEQGVLLANVNEYDVIILDLGLPKKSGEDVCVEIRKKRSSVPILMLSADADVSSKVNLLNSGADDYVSKPFSFQEVLARVHALLRRQARLTEEILQVGELTLDNARHVVKKVDQEIHLTKKEFMFLELLMKNKGAVVSRGMIFEHVWDMNADPFSNTIEVHVRNLRKKTGADGSSFAINTVSGRGYKIEETKI